jgi:hypothetical protein
MATKKKAAKKPVLRVVQAPVTKAKRQLLKVYDSVRMRLGDLVPDPGNPREMGKADFEKLVASLGEFGLVEPFVARAENKRIVGGHQRGLGVAEYLRRNGVGEDEIPDQEITVVFVPGLTESKCRALNMALNRVHGDWVYDLLRDYMGGVEAADMALTGFADTEVQDILALAGDQEDDDIDPDQALAAMKLQFSFKVANQEEADICKQVLAAYGMTGNKDAAAAFVKALVAAKKRVRLPAPAEAAP